MIKVRYDLSFSPLECEMLWIEIERELASHILCGIVYRRSSSNLENLLNNCIISGDFNINLLNYDKHPPTEESINTLNSYFFGTSHIKTN